MTAPRRCRKCGADLPGNVMWCLRCYEPVRQLTPREPQLPAPAGLRPLGPVAVRRDQARIRLERGTYSRAASGPTSFGLAGRIALTVAVLVGAVWLAVVVVFLVFFLVGWWVALLLIGDIWKREYVPAAATDIGSGPSPTAPTPWQRLPDAARKRLGAPEPSSVPIEVPTPTLLKFVRVLGVLLFLTLAVAWQVAGDVVRACLLMSASLAALVLAVNWLRKT